MYVQIFFIHLLEFATHSFSKYLSGAFYMQSTREMINIIVLFIHYWIYKFTPKVFKESEVYVE